MNEFTALPIPNIDIPSLPDVSPITDTSMFIMERAGTGRIYASALIPYLAPHFPPYVLPTFTQTGSGAVARTYDAKLRDVVTARDFGAAGDGIADDTAAINAALASAPNVEVRLGNGNFLVSGTLNVPANASLTGVGGNTTITAAAGNYNSIRIAGSNVSVRNLILQQAAKTGGTDFLMDVTAGDMIEIRVADVQSYSGFGFWADTGTGTNAYYMTYLQRCQARLLRYVGWSFSRSMAHLYVEDCLADFVGSSGPVNWAGFGISGSVLAARAAVGGAFFARCSVQGTSGTTAAPNQAGFAVDHFAAIWLTDCIADTCDGIGFSFDTVNHVRMVDCNASICNSYGMALKTVGWSQFTGNEIMGRNTLSGAAGIHAVACLSGCNRVTFANTQITQCTGDGYNIPTQAGPVNITGGVVSDCTGRGISASGTTGVLATGVTLTNNTAGNYNMSGIFQYLHSSQLHNGTVVSVGPGPVSG